MQSKKEHLILKLPTANAAAITIIVFANVFGVLLFFFDIPEQNKSTFNLLITSVLMPLTVGAMWHLFQYRKKDEES